MPSFLFPCPPQLPLRYSSSIPYLKWGNDFPFDSCTASLSDSTHFTAPPYAPLQEPRSWKTVAPEASATRRDASLVAERRATHLP